MDCFLAFFALQKSLFYFFVHLLVCSKVHIDWLYSHSTLNCIVEEDVEKGSVRTSDVSWL